MVIAKLDLSLALSCIKLMFLEYFSKARAHPRIPTDLYNKLKCEYLLISYQIPSAMENADPRNRH